MADQELPDNVSFEILDLGNCQSGSEAVFAYVTKLPLEFQTEYPNGKECGAIKSAKVGVVLED